MMSRMKALFVVCAVTVTISIMSACPVYAVQELPSAGGCVSPIGVRAKSFREDAISAHSSIYCDGASLSYSLLDSKEDISTVTMEKMALLQQSDALMSLFIGASDQDIVDAYLIFFAEHSTRADVERFVESTQGKHFVIQGTVNSPSISLEEGRPYRDRDVPTCWRGWLAAFAYFAAQGMTCGPLHLAGGVPGFVCDGVFFAIGLLPDFNASCK